METKYQVKEKNQITLPAYELVEKQGPDHAPIFLIRLIVDGSGFVEAEGPSRRQAEKTAAGLMLKKIK